MERKAYEVIVEEGMLVYKQSREILDTTGEPQGVKWIFVLSTSKAFFIGPKRKGVFHHSSFLAGGATSAAGRIVVEKGVIKAIVFVLVYTPFLTIIHSASRSNKCSNFVF